MLINKINPDTRRCLSAAKRSAYQYFAHTADLSAFAGYSALPLNLLNFIIGHPSAPSPIQATNVTCMIGSHHG
jgi:hypothetical protein